jgi:TfoX/Sxy family transcriptional regulator of competence genes
MAYSEKLATRVRAAFAHLPKVEEKKMFRGLTFMVDGKMCVSVSGTRLMCRIDPAVHDEAISKKNVRPVMMGGKEYRGFVYVDESSLHDQKEFDHWVTLALDFNKVAKSSKKSKKRT